MRKRTRWAFALIVLFALPATMGLRCAAPAPPNWHGAGTCRGFVDDRNGYDIGQIIDDAFAGQDQNKAQRIANRESTCDEGATNARSGAQGLFQLLGKSGYLEAACPGYPGGSWYAAYNAVCNARAARIVVDEQGWGPWGG